MFWTDNNTRAFIKTVISEEFKTVSSEKKKKTENNKILCFSSASSLYALRVKNNYFVWFIRTDRLLRFSRGVALETIRRSEHMWMCKHTYAFNIIFYLIHATYHRFKEKYAHTILQGVCFISLRFFCFFFCFFYDIYRF